MYWALIVLHVVVCAFLILVVLLQAGKGGGMGIAFGGGGSQTVFGSSGAGNFLTKLTAICAAIFFANSLLLAYMSSRSDSTRLQKLADRQAVSKKADESAKGKMNVDLEKARQAIEKAAATPPAGTTGTPAAGTATTPAPGAAPSPAAAPAPAAKPAPAPAAAPAAVTKPGAKPAAKPAGDQTTDSETKAAKPAKPSKASKPAGGGESEGSQPTK
jgi:preprotein translocase subunit SecG